MLHSVIETPTIHAFEVSVLRKHWVSDHNQNITIKHRVTVTNSIRIPTKAVSETHRKPLTCERSAFSLAWSIFKRPPHARNKLHSKIRHVGTSCSEGAVQRTLDEICTAEEAPPLVSSPPSGAWDRYVGPPQRPCRSQFVGEN